MNILASACLLGVACRYDGNSAYHSGLIRLMQKHNLVPVCPEIFGGLPTPRTPSERADERVAMKTGEDVTEQFMRGAQEALKLARLFGCKYAVMKERSPSCGSGRICDGTFTGALTDGWGVAAQLLRENGVTVVGESEIERLEEMEGESKE